jgi:hypothetical protein
MFLPISEVTTFNEGLCVSGIFSDLKQEIPFLFWQTSQIFSWIYLFGKTARKKKEKRKPRGTILYLVR